MRDENAIKSFHGIGVMTGTSMDAVDLAYCQFSPSETGWSFDILKTASVPIDEVWYKRLFCLDTQSAEVFAKTNVYYGHFLGRIIHSFISKNKLKPQFVACHGQTIFHQPGKNFTAQIGDGETIVSYLDCPLVSNFRNKDIALGGQGAPLVPFGEQRLFPGKQVFLNLGGFANLSFGNLGFDVCACNLVLNHLAFRHDKALQYDPEGSIAESGELDQTIFDTLQALGFYAQKPPKSLGREWMEAEVMPLLASEELAIPDLLHTYVKHIATQIKSAIKSVSGHTHPVLITGGGARNKFLIDCLEKEGLQIKHDLSIDLIDFKEALIFAFLGMMVLRGKPNISSKVTGAKSDVLGGSIHLPADGFGLALI